MRELGERVDIIKAMNRVFAARGQERDLGTYVLHGHKVAEPILGRIVEKQLADELGDSINVVLDGIDGGVHYLTVADARRVQEASIGTIVEIGQMQRHRPPRSHDR